MNELKDAITVRTEIEPSWWNRLRVLCGALVVVRVVVETEHIIGRTKVLESDVSIRWPGELRDYAQAAELPEGTPNE